LSIKAAEESQVSRALKVSPVKRAAKVSRAWQVSPVRRDREASKDRRARKVLVASPVKRESPLKVSAVWMAYPEEMALRVIRVTR
jgi:hypothetical protein